MTSRYRVEIEQEEDGRFLAEVVDLPGVLAYAESAEVAPADAEQGRAALACSRAPGDQPSPRSRSAASSATNPSTR
jgi:hypothetical protein